MAAYRRLLYRIALILSAGAVAAVLWFGVAIYPAAQFFGVISGADKLALAKKLSLVCLACAAAVLIIAPGTTRLSIRSGAVLVADCFIPTAAVILFAVAESYVAAYIIAAAALISTSALLLSLALDILPSKAPRKAPFIVCALLIAPIFAVSVYLNVINSLFLLPLIWYGAFFTLPVATFALLCIIRARLPRFCAASTAVAGLSLPLGIALLPFKTEITANIVVALFSVGCALSVASIIYKYKEFNMSNINKVIPGLGFHHIALRVNDFDKSYAFYTALGMTPYAAWGEGNGRVQMFDLGDGTILEMFAGGSDEFQAAGKYMHFAMKCDDVDAAYAKAIEIGARPCTPPKDAALNSTPDKMLLHIAFVYGPDGEQLEFFSIKSKG